MYVRCQSVSKIIIKQYNNHLTQSQCPLNGIYLFHYLVMKYTEGTREATMEEAEAFLALKKLTLYGAILMLNEQLQVQYKKLTSQGGMRFKTSNVIRCIVKEARKARERTALRHLSKGKAEGENLSF